MLGKLLKYEVKATAMTFGLLYLAIIGFAICNKVFGSFQFNWGAVITGTVLVGLFVALGVVTIVVVVQRFKRNLLGDEGYLMFTLPVKAGSLITSKLLVTIMWTVASCIVGLITFSILISGEINVYEIIKLLGEEWSRISSEFFANTHMQLSIYLILMAIGMLACYVEFILIIYTALSCAQLSVFNKHRSVIAFGFFFLINLVINNILPSVIVFKVVNLDNFSPQMAIMGGIALVIIIDIVLFTLTNIILNKHLNLE